ncbi:chondroitin sulfate synthase 1-like protein [Dermatophagoides farinae]|uniref:Hexosyltransferase n=1 Tax=Dermatophagoides farinae TaxID=6954 RepID=A0A9D4P2X7_DERFA|nr:chondroitin sulfate synthase 1-like protein [Dermatophagoides farinae]
MKKNYGKSFRTLKQAIHIVIGIIIGSWITCQFRLINYENFKKDILYQLCSYRSSWLYDNDNDVIHVSTKNDLAHTFHSIHNMTSTNHQRKLLLIGVMTAKSFLDTRAQTIYDTWGRDLPGDVLFFTSSNQKTNSNLPFVALPQVDDSYPPQKKSFFMFKFMNDYFGDRYKFFMRADDDVFVNVERLKNFLESLNSSESIYIGQTGVGNKEEFGQLNLDSHDNFCMGGPGVIISFKSLAKIASNVKYCLQNLYSTHEDVEIGRCLRQFAGISCTWSYDMQNLFHHNSSIQTSILNDMIPSKDLLNALTIHPIKNPNAMKNLYRYFKSIDHQNLNFQITKLFRRLNILLIATTNLNYDWKDLLSMKFKTLINIKRLANEAENIGFYPSLKVLFTKTLTNPTWKFFTQKLYTEKSLNPKKNIEKDIVQAFNQNIEQIMNTLNHNSFKKGTLFDYHSLHYGYVRSTQSIGTQFVLDFLMMYRKYQGKRLTIPIRKHVYAVQTFSPTRLLHLEDKPVDIVNVIVPLAGRILTFKRFVRNFIQVYRQDDRLTLTVVLFPNHSNQTVSEIEIIMKEFSGTKNILQVDGKFSRGTALQQSSLLFNNSSLLFFLDVDMLFTEQVLHRVRRNTIFKQQVYYPIVFSQYQNSLKKLITKNESIDDQEFGYWRQFGYGIVSVYNQDLISVGGYDTNINGWGMEDVNLYDRFIASNLTIFRSADPDLIHIYHAIHCDNKLSSIQYEMCLGTKFFSLDSINTISTFIQQNHLLLD